MSALDQLWKKPAGELTTAETTILLIDGSDISGGRAIAYAAAAELARLQAVEKERDALVNAMKSNSAMKLVLPYHHHVTRKLYWATDTEQWEVYSHNPSNRNAITWHYKGDSLTDALVALERQP